MNGIGPTEWIAIAYCVAEIRVCYEGWKAHSNAPYLGKGELLCTIINLSYFEARPSSTPRPHRRIAARTGAFFSPKYRSLTKVQNYIWINYPQNSVGLINTDLCYLVHLESRPQKTHLEIFWIQQKEVNNNLINGFESVPIEISITIRMIYQGISRSSSDSM